MMSDADSRLEIVAKIDELSASKAGENFGLTMGVEAGKKLQQAIDGAMEPSSAQVAMAGRTAVGGGANSAEAIARKRIAGKERAKEISSAYYQQLGMGGRLQKALPAGALASVAVNAGGGGASLAGGAAGMMLGGPAGAIIGAQIGDAVGKVIGPAMKVHVTEPLKNALFGIESTGAATVGALETYTEQFGQAAAEFILGQKKIQEAQDKAFEMSRQDDLASITNGVNQQISSEMPIRPGETNASYFERTAGARKIMMSEAMRMRAGKFALGEYEEELGFGGIREATSKSDMNARRRYHERRKEAYDLDTNMYGY